MNTPSHPTITRLGGHSANNAHQAGAPNTQPTGEPMDTAPTQQPTDQGKDTTMPTTYQVCVECGAEYASAAALMAAHDQRFTPNPRWLLFCPECLHDFAFRPGGEVDLTGHAAVLAECLRRNGFDPAHAVERHVIKLQEEAGEVAGAYLRSTGQARRSGTTEELHEEVADVILTASSLAHHLEMDLNAVITAKLHKIHTRGWRDNTPATTTESEAAA